TSNIIVAVDENTPDYGNNPSWAGYILAPSSGNKSIYYYSDSTNPNPASPPTASSRSNTVAQIQFVGSLLAPCTGTPSAGTASANPARGTEGSTYVLSTTGATNGMGLT